MLGLYHAVAPKTRYFSCVVTSLRVLRRDVTGSLSHVILQATRSVV